MFVAFYEKNVHCFCGKSHKKPNKITESQPVTTDNEIDDSRANKTYKIIVFRVVAKFQVIVSQ